MSALTPAAAPGFRTLLAKLSIGFSAVVALATSGPPPWTATEEQQLRVALNEMSEQRVLLTIELAGPLYHGAYDGTVELSAVADRAASDFSLEARPLTPDALALDSFGAPQADAGSAPDGGAGTRVVQPTLEFPDRVSLQMRLTCTELEAERPETCLAQAELRLARESARQLDARLSVIVRLAGYYGPDRPPGTLTIDLQELAP